jgi:hypothetical protein
MAISPYVHTPASRPRVDNWQTVQLLTRTPASESAFAIRAPARYSFPVSTLAEIEQAAKVLPVDQKQRLIATLLAGLPKRGASSTSGENSDEAVHASLIPLAATSWSQDWDSAEEDEAWRDL